MGDEALLDRIVDLRKAHHRNAHTLRRHCSSCLLRSYAGNRRIRLVFLGGEAAWGGSNRGSGGDDQGAVRADKRGAESLNGAAVDLADFVESCEIVDESGVNDTVGGRGSAAQTVQIFHVPPMDFGAYGGQRLSARI